MSPSGCDGSLGLPNCKSTSWVERFCLSLAWLYKRLTGSFSFSFSFSLHVWVRSSTAEGRASIFEAKPLFFFQFSFVIVDISKEAKMS